MSRDASLAGRFSDLSRRAFLRRGAAGVGIVAAVSSVPGLASILQVSESDAPAVASTAQDAAPLTEEQSGMLNSGTPLVAHITDVSTGQMSVYVGERQISYQDPELANRLLRALAG